VRSDCEAPARTTGGAASLGGVGSPWPWAVLAWAALLVAIVVSFRPAVPVIWGDTPAFVESALRTLEAGKPTVAGGRDPGYPALLAVTFAFGGGLGAVVRVQQAAWVVLVLALAATAQAATRNAGARASTGEVLIFVDADTRIDAAVVRAALAALRSGAVGGGAKGIAAIGHQDSTSVSARAFDCNPHAGGSGNARDHPERSLLTFQHRTLLNMQLDERRDALLTVGRDRVARDRLRHLPICVRLGGLNLLVEPFFPDA